MKTKAEIIPKGILLPFVLITSLFFLWGLANNMTDTFLAAFKNQSLAVFALVIVSCVVKVFEAIIKSVVSGSTFLSIYVNDEKQMYFTLMNMQGEKIACLNKKLNVGFHQFEISSARKREYAF